MNRESRRDLYFRKRKATRLTPTIKLKIMDMKILALENQDEFGSTGSAEWMSNLVEHIEDEAVEIQDVRRWASNYPWILDERVIQVPKSPKHSPRAPSRRRRRQSSPSPPRRDNKRAARASASNVVSVSDPIIDEAHEVVTNFRSVKMEPVEDDDSDEEGDAAMDQSAFATVNNVNTEYNASASTESVDQDDAVDEDDVFVDYSDVPLDLSHNAPHLHESNDEAEQECAMDDLEPENCVRRLVIQIGGKEYEGFIPENQIDDPNAFTKIGFQEVVKKMTDLHTQDENKTELEPGTSASGRTNAESPDNGNTNETPSADTETSSAVSNQPNDVPDSNAESMANMQQASVSGITVPDNRSSLSASSPSSSLGGVSMQCNAGSSNPPVLDSSNSDSSAGSSTSSIRAPGVSDYDVSHFLKNNPIQWSNNFLIGYGQYPANVQTHPPAQPQSIELSPPQKQSDSDTENKKSVAIIPYGDMRMPNRVYPPWSFEESLITQNVIGHLSALKMCLASLPDSAVLVQPFNLFVHSFSAYQGRRVGLPQQTRF